MRQQFDFSSYNAGQNIQSLFNVFNKYDSNCLQNIKNINTSNTSINANQNLSISLAKTDSEYNFYSYDIEKNCELNLTVLAKNSTKTVLIVNLKEHSKLNLNILNIAINSKNVAINLYIYHEGSFSASNITVKNISKADGLTMVCANLIVPKPALECETNLNVESLLLDAGKSVVIPNLEIEGENIKKATHSAKIHQINPDMLLYMTSRGLNKPAVQNILVENMTNLCLKGIYDNAIRESLTKEALKELN